MTEAQLQALARLAGDAGHDPWGSGVSNDVWPVVVKRLWPLIRDMVLEAAAARLKESNSPDAWWFAVELRDMKGTKP